MKVAPLRVMIVEDEAVLAMDIEAMVEDCGHFVVAEAASLKDVEALPALTCPDIVFVDVQLAEGSSGLDVCAYVRLHWRDAVVVFVTANPKKIPEDFAGAHGVIAKPFSRNGLLHAMRYISNGLIDPPPSLGRPSSFNEAPAFAETWTQH